MTERMRTRPSVWWEGGGATVSMSGHLDLSRHGHTSPELLVIGSNLLLGCGNSSVQLG